MQTKLLLVLSLNDDAGRQDEWMTCEGNAELLLYVAVSTG